MTQIPNEEVELTVELDAELEARLAEYCQATGKDKETAIKEALQAFVDFHERADAENDKGA
ncbi:putative transcriptional regulator [Pseudomonas nitritireducens]|uniref:Putative transcriptional regulator n=1 Tax=Pseudomonas nitroreducens TaxID=46680 RepID=A0A7W7KRB1_PSENT|nr:ribbon-helix-helix protein, CopG family [Pseudomonas nitritireducens]MBB4867416.1 putative transcriptional regulator [Pseudomonas nitritireducens]